MDFDSKVYQFNYSLILYTFDLQGNVSSSIAETYYFIVGKIKKMGEPGYEEDSLFVYIRGLMDSYQVAHFIIKDGKDAIT